MINKRNSEHVTVRVDPVLEAIARALSGIGGVPLDEQIKMIHRAAKDGAKALRALAEEEKSDGL